MTKLTMAYALLALEEAGYEQASNKPMAFGKVMGPITITCRVSVENDIIRGEFTALIQYVGLNYSSKLSVPLMIGSDVTKAEKSILVGLEEKVIYSRDEARNTWETLDKTYLNLQTLLRLAEPKK